MATTKARRAGSDLPPQIRQLSASVDGLPRMIIFGEPGVGKTPLAASAPNALTLDGDGGMDSALASGSTSRVWSMRDWNDALEAYNWLQGGGWKQLEWVNIDSLTLLQELGLDDIMDDLVVTKPHRSIYLPDKGEYGQNACKPSRWLRDMKRLPVKQIWTAHAKMMEITRSDGSTFERMMPNTQGNGLAEKLCGYVPIVAHIESVQSKKDKDKEYPVLTTSKKDGWYGKDRYGAIGRMPHPTVPKVMAAIEAKLDPSNASTEKEE